MLVTAHSLLLSEILSILKTLLEQLLWLCGISNYN